MHDVGGSKDGAVSGTGDRPTASQHRHRVEHRDPGCQTVDVPLLGREHLRRSLPDAGRNVVDPSLRGRDVPATARSDAGHSHVETLLGAADRGVGSAGNAVGDGAERLLGNIDAVAGDRRDCSECLLGAGEVLLGSGDERWAHAVGVLNDALATSSAMLRSIS